MPILALLHEAVEVTDVPLHESASAGCIVPRDRLHDAEKIQAVALHEPTIAGQEAFEIWVDVLVDGLDDRFEYSVPGDPGQGEVKLVVLPDHRIPVEGG